MNLEKGPVYPKAEITITYVQGRYGYVIKTSHPKFGPVEYRQTAGLNLSEQQAIVSAKFSIRNRISCMETASNYPKKIQVDLTPIETKRISWFRRLLRS